VVTTAATGLSPSSSIASHRSAPLRVHQNALLSAAAAASHGYEPAWSVVQVPAWHPSWPVAPRLLTRTVFPRSFAADAAAHGARGTFCTVRAADGRGPAQRGGR